MDLDDVAFDDSCWPYLRGLASPGVAWSFWILYYSSPLALLQHNGRFKRAEHTIYMGPGQMVG